MFEMNPWQLFMLGGPMMWPILLCSILTLALVLEKWKLVRLLKEDTVKLRHRLFELVRANKIREALSVCESSDTPTARVLKSGVLNYGCSKEEVMLAMEETARFEVPRLEERLPALLTIATTAQLLGFLGTVTGMCSLFHVIQIRAASLSPLNSGDVAGGIWQALITTMAGLVVSIPAFLAHGFFSARQREYVLAMEKNAVSLANFLTRISNSAESKVEELP